MAEEKKELGLKVAIVGAGAAGLMASNILRRAGLEVIHLEAADRVGGRIQSLVDRNFGDGPIELGAEELHGAKSAFYLAAKNHPTIKAFDGYNDTDDFYFVDGQVKGEGQLKKDRDLKALDQFEDAVEHYNAKEPDNITLAEFAQQRNLSQRFKGAFEAYWGSEYGTDSYKLSLWGTAEVIRHWKSGAQNFALKGGSYYDVLCYMVGQEVMDSVRINQQVTCIDTQTPGQVTLTVLDRTHQTTYPLTVDKVVVTVPLGVLQSGDIQFVPALPDSYASSFAAMGIDAGMKIILKFKKRFWPKYLGSIYAPGLVHEFWPPLVGKATNNVLTAYVMGDGARTLSQMSHQQAIQTVVDELDAMFGAGVASSELERGLVHDWFSNPFVKGAYSYPRVGDGGRATRQKLHQPINNTIFFAGEHLSENHPATSHGAVESGTKAAQLVIASIQT
eukprot:TRINITY_DN1519_c0_g1_i5.p1 TRINITY_DN1519_c0_g1~~TRINITY_DN1519_c0_g1_i5.p1  ORF type:complete len:472 (+),score=119.07 TRINITY_DN1519_c0_g1_i5:79-1416(+)